MNHFWSFLGHGGFKLLIIAFFVLANFAKARAKESKKRDDQLRGKTDVSDFSSPDKASNPVAKPSPPGVLAPQSPPKSTPKPQNSDLGSPWSSNQNPFN